MKHVQKGACPRASRRGGATARSYRNRAIPITYVLDRKGVIRFIHLATNPGRDEMAG